MRSFHIAVTASLVVLPALMPSAALAQCPPNSHSVAVYIPGNLRTAHCWCDNGYINSGGACVRTRQPTPPPGLQAQPSPNGTSMNPVR